MTGLEHYLEAERLEGQALGAEAAGNEPEYGRLMQRAQLHAMLAQAAATAMNDSETGMHEADYHAWYGVCGIKR